MSMPEFLRRTTAWLTRARRERELHEELAAHIAARTEENIQRGIAPAEARRQALVQFGNPAVLGEESREAWGFIWLETLLLDLLTPSRRVGRALGWDDVQHGDFRADVLSDSAREVHRQTVVRAAEVGDEDGVELSGAAIDEHRHIRFAPHGHIVVARPGPRRAHRRAGWPGPDDAARACAKSDRTFVAAGLRRACSRASSRRSASDCGAA